MGRKNFLNSFENKSVLVIIAICCLFVLLKLIIYTNNVAFYDEGIYIGISKYILSHGQMGYFESIRPLGLSLILAPLLYLSHNPLIIARILSIILFIFCIFLVFSITKKLFGNVAGVWAAIFFTFSPTMIIFSGYLLTDIFAYSIMLLGGFLCIRKRYFLSGLVIGASFLLRFPAILMSLSIIFLIAWRKNKIIKNSFLFILGMLGLLVPYLLFNLFYYTGSLFNRLFSPLLNASEVVASKSFSINNLWLYLGYLISIELLITLFAAFGIYYSLKSKRDIFLCYTIGFFIFLLYFSLSVGIFDIRYALSFIQLLVIFSGFGASKFLNKRKRISLIIIIMLLLSILITVYSLTFNAGKKTDQSIISALNKYGGADFVSNSGLTLIYTNSKSIILPGPNLVDTYLKYNNDENAKILAINPEEYSCQYYKDKCRDLFLYRMSYFLSNNNIYSCGYLHGIKMIIIDKENNLALISKSECLANIDIKEIPAQSKKILVLLSNVEINSSGDIKYFDRVSAITEQLESKDIETVLDIYSTKQTFNKKTIEFFNNSLKIGITTFDDASASKFINYIEKSTNKKVTYLIPPDYDFYGKDTLKARNMNCIVGPWDSSVEATKCKKISFNPTVDFNQNKYYNSSSMIKNYNAVSKVDYDLVIDIPVDRLYDDKMFNEVIKFLDYVINEN
jgi:hypothetical protein